MGNDRTSVIRLKESDVEEIISVFCDAFYDYPVMRGVIGSAGDDYNRRLHALIELFVMRRIWNQDPILGIFSDGKLVACATLTAPNSESGHKVNADKEEMLWQKLDQQSRQRYEGFCTVWAGFAFKQPHYHVNMIGTRQSYQAQGLAKQLLDVVHAMSRGNSISCGVSLTTEDPQNISFYEHVGYKVINNLKLSADIRTWGFFRQNEEEGN